VISDNFDTGQCRCDFGRTDSRADSGWYPVFRKSPKPAGQQRLMVDALRLSTLQNQLRWVDKARRSASGTRHVGLGHRSGRKKTGGRGFSRWTSRLGAPRPAKASTSSVGGPAIRRTDDQDRHVGRPRHIH
jgi:hypothetical protein